MKLQDKIKDGYYYPEPDENIWAIGMRVEIQVPNVVSSDPNEKGFIWIEIKIDGGMNDIFDLCQDDVVRIPLLTKEDIEEEGWEFVRRRLVPKETGLGAKFDMGEGFYFELGERAGVVHKLHFKVFNGNVQINWKGFFHCPTRYHLRQLMEMAGIGGEK